MMKKILCLVIAILTLTGCEDSRVANVEESQPSKLYETGIYAVEKACSKEESEEAVEACSKEENEETEEDLYDWQIELTEEMIQNLPDVPDWDSKNAYIAFLRGYKPSNEIVRIYNQKEENDELLSGYLDIYYQGQRINDMSLYEDELYSNAMFKQDDYIVTGHQSYRSIIMTYPDGDSKEIKLDIIPQNCILLTTVSVAGNYSNFFEGFSICYDQETSEAVCVRFDEEIGERIKISSKDIEEFLDREEAIESHPFLSIGYINNNNELVYPTIIEDESGIRFELLKKSLKSLDEQLIYFSSAIINNINFKAYNNNVYIIDDVKRRVNLDVSQGFCYGIWTTGEAKIKEIPIDYSQLNDIEIEILIYYNDKQKIEVCASMGELTIFGKDTYMYQGQFNNDNFQRYLFNEDVLDRGINLDTYLNINLDNWIEAEPTLTKLKEGIIKQEADN